MKKVFSILAAMLIVSSTAWAKNETIRVKAPKEVVAEQVFQVAYLIQGNGEEIQISSNKKIEPVGGPYRTSNSRDLRHKGKLQTKTWTKYVVNFVAHESGELKLPKVTIRIDGSKKSAPKTKISIIDAEPYDPFFGNAFNDPFFSDPFFGSSFSAPFSQDGHRCNGSHFHHGSKPCPHRENPRQYSTPKAEEIDTTGCLVTVTAPDTVTEGEPFYATYSIGAKCDSIALTDSTHFEILGTTGFSTGWQTSIENGKHSSRFTQGYTYLLRPRKAGVFPLPIATIMVGETPKQSAPKSITIEEKKK